MNKSSLEEFAK